MGKPGLACLCCLLIILIPMFVAIGALFFVVVKLATPPKLVRYTISDALLAEFNFSSSESILHYNLTFDIDMKNPNKDAHVTFDKIEVYSIVRDQRFGMENGMPFSIMATKSFVLSPKFIGQRLMVLTSKDLNELKSSKVFDLEVKLYVDTRYKGMLWKFTKFRSLKSEINCKFKVPLTPDAEKPSVEFRDKKCTYV